MPSFAYYYAHKKAYNYDNMPIIMPVMMHSGHNTGPNNGHNNGHNNGPIIKPVMPMHNGHSTGHKNGHNHVPQFLCFGSRFSAGRGCARSPARTASGRHAFPEIPVVCLRSLLSMDFLQTDTNSYGF